MSHNRRFYPYIWGGWLLLGLITLLAGPVWAGSPEPVASCAETYTVQADDWLSKIADKSLGSVLAYPAIVAATNQRHTTDVTFAQIVNPDLIEVGWKLCLPPATEAQTELVAAAVPPPSTANLDTLTPYTLDDFVAQFKFGPNIKPEWLYTSPEKLTKYDILPEHQERAGQYGYRANYLWNNYLSDDYFRTSGIFKTIPPEITAFDPPSKTAYPRYRYPANVTLPTGLTTNQFGWRGPQIELKKPAKVIRIACLGASTTVDTHSLPYSYPELLQHWLNLWAEENGYSARFEVINAGREGIGSRDIAAVAQYEILPMDVDYVIYYEGANQFDPRSMVQYPPDVVFGQPPPDTVPNFSNVESTDKSLLDTLSEYSALAARARSLVEQLYYTGAEPLKPEQTFILPPGEDELKPDRAHLGQVLGLNAILNDLDQIKQTLTQHKVKFMLATFDWFAYDGLVIDPARHRNLYGYLNRVYWPISYANIRRMADFQNRVFKGWAAQTQTPLIDVAGQMPRHPDLYDDAIHNTQLGIRLRAWLNFEALVPHLKKDIEAKRLPRSRRVFYKTHPYLNSEFITRPLPAN